MRALVVAVYCLVATILLMPVGAGHNAQLAPEQYERFLSDCSDDWGGHSAVRDGHDLIALDVTERWMSQHLEPGFFVLLTVGFGFAETGSRGGPLRDEVELTGPDGSIKVRLTTMDNAEFAAETGEGLRVPDEIVRARPSLLSNGQQDGSRILIEFGFRYSTLGLDVGEKFTAAKAQAFARQDRGDFMPGGYYLPGGLPSSSDINACPQSGHQGGGDIGGRWVRKDYALRGPETPYMELFLEPDALAVSGGDVGLVSLNIKNRFVKDAQDLRVTPVVPAGWKTTVSSSGALRVEAGQALGVPIELSAPTGVAANGTLQVVVDTAAGGHGVREIPLYWYPKGVAASVPVPTTNEAPVPFWTIFAALLGGALFVVRRRPG